MLLALCMLLAGVGCGSSGEGGGSSVPNNPVWVFIDPSGLETVVTGATVTLSGQAYCGGACPESEVGVGYCPALQSVPGVPVDVTWHNRATGEGGAAVHGVHGEYVLLFSYCWTSYSHRWLVYSVPLAMGDNPIDVTATDTTGNTATDSVVVTRVPVPAFYRPTGVALDLTRGELLVSGTGDFTRLLPATITVYDRTAADDAAPLRVLAGPATGLAPQGIAVDPDHDAVVVANYDYWQGWRAVSTYPLSADGDVAPLRAITGNDIGLANPWAVAVDAAHGELFAVSGSGSGTAVTVHDLTADGNAPPLRTIAGPGTGLVYVYGMAFDPGHDELLLTNILDGATGGSLLAYARTASGDAAPLREIRGQHTGLGGPRGIALDPMHDEVFVTDFVDDSVKVFARSANGDAAPLRVIRGARTGLLDPYGVAVDPARGEVFVTNADHRVTVYTRTAAGDAEPLRILAGAHPGL